MQSDFDDASFQLNPEDRTPLPIRQFRQTLQRPSLLGMRVSFTASCPGEPAPPVVDTVQSTAADHTPLPIRHFRQMLVSPPLRGMCAPMTPSCPGEPVPPNVDAALYAYNPRQLQSVLTGAPNAMVLYRGTAPELPDVAGHHLHREYLTVFSTAQRGPLALTSRDVFDLLTGRLRQWDALGHGSGAIRLLAHGAPVNQETFLTGLAQRTGLTKATASIELHSSYTELTEAARDCPDCIVFGLRPSWLKGDHLLPVTLDGHAPWLPGLAPSIPSLDISLIWRRRTEDAPAQARAMRDILATIGARLEADAKAFKGLAPDVGRLAG